MLIEGHILDTGSSGRVYLEPSTFPIVIRYTYPACGATEIGFFDTPADWPREPAFGFCENCGECLEVLPEADQLKP